MCVRGACALAYLKTSFFRKTTEGEGYDNEDDEMLLLFLPRGLLGRQKGFSEKSLSNADVFNEALHIDEAILVQ